MLDTSSGNIPEYIKIGSPRTLSIKVIKIKIQRRYRCKAILTKTYLKPSFLSSLWRFNSATKSRYCYGSGTAQYRHGKACAGRRAARD
jgi:hypothetical protein